MNTTNQTVGSYRADAPVSNPLNATTAGGSCCGPAMQNRGLSRFVPAWLGGSRGMILAALAIVGAGLAFGWPTVVALGIAPIVLSLLPCAVMCSLGLCMMGKGRQTAPPQGFQTTPPQGFSLQANAGDQPPALVSAGPETLIPTANAYERERQGSPDPLRSFIST